MAELFGRFAEPENYINRELSWLEFNDRVLGEARDKTTPLFDRLKFLSITASNLDEFFMVRVASLKDMVHVGYTKTDIAGMTAQEQLEVLSTKTHELTEQQYCIYNRSLVPALKQNGLRIITDYESLTKYEALFVDQYFEEVIYPVLTPMAVDSSRPFPLIRNKSLNIAALVKNKKGDGELDFVMVRVPKVLSRVIVIPPESSALPDEDEADEFDEDFDNNENMDHDEAAEPDANAAPEKTAGADKTGVADKNVAADKSGVPDKTVAADKPGAADKAAMTDSPVQAGPVASSVQTETTVIFLEEIIERNIHKLFLNYDIVCSHPFRVMRNADLSIDEDEAEDLLQEIEKQLKKRQWGEAIRLDIEEGADKRLLKILKKELHVSTDEIYEMRGPLDLTVLMKVFDLPGFDALKTPRYTPQPVVALMNDDDIFTNIRKGDILLCHPYESFKPVVGFIQTAAKDPDVLAIKQTLYRVSGNSPIIAALAEAADNGKQVSVLVELKARFDEENNILWAKMLEKSGCHVIYGLLGLKTHSKITLIVRKEEDGIRRYVHLGTGNYNDSTAKLYTDCGMFTCNRQIGEDATAVFNMLSGYSEPLGWNKLSLAPLWLRGKFKRLIQSEIKNAQSGKSARIIAKMNSLCDKEIIANLYEASCAGVKIDLIIRGICCLKPGIPQLSENITVHSIVGNFLEHARIFYFEHGGEEKIFMGSADWMPRNLDRRVEILFPVEDDKLKERLIHILDVELQDNVKAYVQLSDGTYVRPDKRGKAHVNSQEQFCVEAMAAAKEEAESRDPVKSRVFIPREQ